MILNSNDVNGPLDSETNKIKIYPLRDLTIDLKHVYQDLTIRGTFSPPLLCRNYM